MAVVDKGSSIDLLRTMITSLSRPCRDTPVLKFIPTMSGLRPPCIPMLSGLTTIYRGAHKLIAVSLWWDNRSNPCRCQPVVDGTVTKTLNKLKTVDGMKSLYDS